MLETWIMETEGGIMVQPTDEDVEMSDNATPHQRHFQSDGDVEFVEPYETPVVLQRNKKKTAPAPVNLESEAEVSEVEENQLRKGLGKKGIKAKGAANKKVCSLC